MNKNIFNKFVEEKSYEFQNFKKKINPNSPKDFREKFQKTLGVIKIE